MKNIIILLFLTLSISSCNWIPPGPNEPFFCKINGKNFRPERDTSPIGGIGSDPLRSTWNNVSGRLFISSRNSPFEVSMIFVFENKEVKIGETILMNKVGFSSGVLIPNNDAIPNEQLVSNDGKLTITKVANNQISGTFEFTCKSLKNSKEYKITKGCFNNLTYY